MWLEQNLSTFQNYESMPIKTLNNSHFQNKFTLLFRLQHFRLSNLVRVNYLPFFFVLFSIFSFDILIKAQESIAKDWPTFRHDAKRTGTTAEALPNQLKQIWTRKFSPLKVSWPDDPRIQFDKSYHPIVMGKTIFITSSKNDCLYAISTETGEILWKFFADAPIRFAPTGSKDKLFCVSDDSYLYCLQISTGKLLWKFRGAPNDSKILVNGRLASPWPARGAPAVVENKVYFSAGIWPFMGVFIYAINTETGKPIWINSGSGSLYQTQSHNSGAFTGPAPQGYISATKDFVIIPNGRSAPAAYDAKTGELLHYDLPLKMGGYYTPITDSAYFFAGSTFDLKSGKALGTLPMPCILSSNYLYAGSLQAFDLKNIHTLKPAEKTSSALPLTPLWNEPIKAEIQFLAGERLYATSENSIFAYDLPEFNKEIKIPKLIWKLDTTGTLAEIIPADNKLFAITLEGELICFADDKTTPLKEPLLFETAIPFDEISSTREDLVLLTTDKYKGYAIVLGVGTGGMAEQLTRKTELSIIVIERDLALVEKFRKKWDEALVYGSRIVILHGNPFDYPFPPYIASLVTSEGIDFNKEKISQVVSRIFHTLRPYGGVACLEVPPALKDRWTHAIYENNLQMAGNRNKNGWTLLTKEGQLLGAGTYSHQYADSTNSVASSDNRVKLPLGLLWFGGPSNKNVLSTLGHGPTPQVAGGRVVTQGPSNLQAYDAYTGRILWELNITELGKTFESDERQPGANGIGSNYVTLADYIYVVFRGKCIKLESETGAVIDVFELPPLQGETTSAKWSYIAANGDYLIAGADPLNDDNTGIPGKFTWNGSTSKAIVVLNRHIGKMVWKIEADQGFRHNAIAIGNDKLFCIDLLPNDLKSTLASKKSGGKGKISAYSLSTGNLIWSTSDGVFGTWLSYSAEHDILFQAGRPSKDMLTDEQNNRMSTFQGKDGKFLWDKSHSYAGPCLLIDKEIIAQNVGFNLFDGSQKTKVDTITNDIIGWNFARNHGCDTVVGAKNILTFRSTAAGYYDLTNDSGTGNFGGLRTGCTSNAIIAEGIVNIPDFTRNCSESYQNQTSLALIHQPDVETWTFTNNKWNQKQIQSLGVNLGAPGDRLSDTKTMWIEYPSIGGPAQDIPIKTTPNKITWFRQHSSIVKDTNLSWVGVSGAKGLETISIKTGNSANKEGLYTVRLIFCEPDDVKPNERLMDILIQEKGFFENVDVIKEANGKNKILIKEIKNIRSVGEITITLKSSGNAIKKETLLSGVEIISER